VTRSRPRIISFAIGYGAVFGLLGPNGAGKTTTVRTLGTLIAPTAGSATIAGIALTPENGVQVRQRIARMPESPLLAAWSIWVGIAISTRSSDARVAQQVGALAGLPAILIVYLIAFDLIHATLGPRRHGGAVRPRRTRLAARVCSIRPRTAHHRYPMLTCARLSDLPLARLHTQRSAALATPLAASTKNWPPRWPALHTCPNQALS
jgi:energy-coupling factor transporter ATP-binding protein EcfA2